MKKMEIDPGLLTKEEFEKELEKELSDPSVIKELRDKTPILQKLWKIKGREQ